MKSNIIAVFDNLAKVTAFISSNLDLKIVGYLPLNEEQKLIELIDLYKSNKKIPRLKKESFSSDKLTISLVPISPDNPDFFSAVCEELKISGFTCKIVPMVIEPLLMYVSFNLNDEERSRVIGDIVNLPVEVEAEAIEELQNTLEEYNQLKG